GGGGGGGAGAGVGALAGALALPPRRARGIDLRDPEGRPPFLLREGGRAMSETATLPPVSRRSFLAGVGGAAAALVTSGAPAALAQPAGAIRRGGTFVESINWTYPSLDSHLSSQPFMAGFEALDNTP